MPYVTNAQKEWAQWCDLSSAIHQIRTADNCDEPSAIQQLRLAIADGNLKVKWGDRRKRYVDEPVFDSSDPPVEPEWWVNHAVFNLEDEAWPEGDGPALKGLCRDDWCLAPLYLGGVRSDEQSAVWNWIEQSRNARLLLVHEVRVRFRPLFSMETRCDRHLGLALATFRVR